MPPQKRRLRGGRHPDTLPQVWDSVIVPILKMLPAKRANAVFEEICRHHPVSAAMHPSLQRRIRQQYQDVLPRQHHGFTREENNCKDPRYGCERERISERIAIRTCPYPYEHGRPFACDCLLYITTVQSSWLVRKERLTS